MEDGVVRRIGAPALLAEESVCEAGLATTVADVWRTARLGAPYPLTVAQAGRRGGEGNPGSPSGLFSFPLGRGPRVGAARSPPHPASARASPGATGRGKTT